MDDDWEKMQKLVKIYPNYFEESKCTFEVFKRYSSLITTRCFGWGLPTSVLIPIADSFNHNPKSFCAIDIVNKRLHLI